MIIIRFCLTDDKKISLEKCLSNLHHCSKIKDNETMIVQPNEYESIVAILEALNIDFIREVY